jgi:hypothetical protein
MARFAGLIGAIVWGLGDSLERQRRFGWGEVWLAPLAEVLRGYLADTLARLTALHDRFLAGARRTEAARAGLPVARLSPDRPLPDAIAPSGVACSYCSIYAI